MKLPMSMSSTFSIMAGFSRTLDLVVFESMSQSLALCKGESPLIHPGDPYENPCKSIMSYSVVEIRYPLAISVHFTELLSKLHHPSVESNTTCPEIPISLNLV
jgi:hypothetical protein